MKKILGWKYDESKGVYIQDRFTSGELDEDVGTNVYGDVLQKESYSPNKVRFYNSFEEAQQTRFIVCLHWIKEHFSDLLETEKVKRKKLIIDLGCSRSFVYRRWKNNMNFFNWPQIHYWGVDSNLKRINDGRNSIEKKKNDSLIYFLGDLSEKMVFPAKADVIVCMEVLEHLPVSKARNILNNIYKALKSSGIAIISSPNPKNKGEFVWKDSQKSHFYEYTFEEAEKLFEDNGFSVIDKTGVLPDREYYKQTSFPELREKLIRYLPPPIVNNFLLLAEEDIRMKRQWICKLKKDLCS